MKVNSQSLCKLLVLMSGIFIATNTFAVGECVGDMVNVYSHACDGEEAESGAMCTTRYESTPESYWCCCDKDYKLSQCSLLFDGIFGKSSVTSENAMFLSRGFRDNVLDKSPLGSEYIKLYYANNGNMFDVIKKHPKLAMKTAKAFLTHRQLIIDLNEGKKVTIKKSHKQQIMNLLQNYGEAAGKDSELGQAVNRVYSDLKSGKSLEQFNIRVVD